MGGLVRETALQSVNLWSCWSVNKQNTETWAAPGRLLYSKSDLPVDTSKQKRSFPMASIKRLITVQLTHSFVCLLNVFALLLPSPSFPHRVIHSPPFFYSRHVTNFLNKGCDCKRIHMVWLSRACSINPWRRYVKSCQTSLWLWLNGVNVLTGEMTRATSGLMTTSAAHLLS